MHLRMGKALSCIHIHTTVAVKAPAQSANGFDPACPRRIAVSAARLESTLLRRSGYNWE